MRTIISSMLVIGVSLIAFAALSETKLDHFECPIKKIKFDDGDTISCKGEEIRFLGVDTPEISHPKHGIFDDQPYGPQAAKFTKSEIEKAKRVTIVRSGRDKFGRTLGYVLTDGELLGANLIKAGLAYETISRYGDNGLPEFALQITEAAKAAPKPVFEDPHEWRKKNQRK